MLQGESKSKQGEEWGEEGVVGKTSVQADECVNGEQGIEDEDQFGQLVCGHWRYLGFIVGV
jgi:hypothetical protein